MIVVATKVGFYNSSRRYPAGHGHEDSGKPFRLIERVMQDGTVITPEEQFSEKWMKVVKTTEEAQAEETPKPKKKKASRKKKKKDEEPEAVVDASEVPHEHDRSADAAPLSDGEVRNHPTTLSEMAKAEDKRREAEARASDEEVI
jgi:hypothetical protein